MKDDKFLNFDKLPNAADQLLGIRGIVKLDWHGGLRYPRLEKVTKGAGTLDALLAPR